MLRLRHQITDGKKLSSIFLKSINKQKMKHLIIALVAFAGITTASFAQAPAAKKETTKMKVATTDKKEPAKVVKMTDVKKTAPVATTAATAKPVAVTKPVATPAKATTAAGPVKKDGTADMRFKANKEAAKAPPATTHLKKDGTADKRFKENKKTN
jgi:outer membrane receptor for monomeric catechols